MVLRRLILAILVVVGICIAYKPVLRLCLIPWRVHASWVSDLATQGTTFSGKELPPAYTESFGGVLPDTVRRANEQKRELLKAYESHTGRIGLRRTYATIEGDRIIAWLLVDHGEAEYIYDGTRDHWRGAPGIDRHRVTGITLGFSKDGKFVSGQPQTDGSVIVVLNVAEDHLGHVLFY